MGKFLILYKINKTLIIMYIIIYLVKKVFVGNLVATIVQELSPQCFIFHFVRGKIFWREKKKNMSHIAFLSSDFSTVGLGPNLGPFLLQMLMVLSIKAVLPPPPSPSQ